MSAPIITAVLGDVRCAIVEIHRPRTVYSDRSYLLSQTLAPLRLFHRPCAAIHESKSRVSAALYIKGRFGLTHTTNYGSCDVEGRNFMF